MAGWMSWERYRCEVDCDAYPNDCINAKLYQDMADRLAEDGWLDVGYEYVNVVRQMKNHPHTLAFICGLGAVSSAVEK